MTEAYERNLAERSLERLGVKSGDNLYINYDQPGDPLRVEIERLANQNGADVFLREFDREQQRRKYQKAAKYGADALGSIEEELQKMEKMDYWIRVRAHDSPTASINREGKAVWRNWREDVLEERLHNTDWLLVEYPSQGWSDLAGMSVEELKEEYANAQLRDWEAMKERDSVLKELLTEASEAKIRSKGYELALSLSNEDINSIGLGAHGELNQPDGEIYTQPIVESVEG